MSFLRSTIADARSRKYSPESNSRQHATPRLQTGGLNQGVSEAKVKSQDSQNPTNHISTSLPMQESSSGEIVADVSVVQESNPINLDNHDIGSDPLDNEKKTQGSMTMHPIVQNSQEITITPTDIDQSPEPSNTLTVSQDVQYRSFDVEPTEDEQTNTDGRSAPDTGEQLRSSDVLETKPVKIAENLIDYNKDTEVIVSPEIEVDGKFEGTNEPQVTHKLKQVRSRDPIFDNSKSLNQAEDVFLKDGTANQVPYGIKKQENIENMSNKKSTISSGKSNPIVTKPDNSERHSNNREVFPVVPAKLFQTDSTLKAFEYRQSKPSYTSAEKRHETPSVQIGQIDVIIEMPAKPASKPTAETSSADLASRHYLRRL
jgi:hypothetical protein